MQSPIADLHCDDHQRFEHALRSNGFDTEDLWINGYVSYQWRTLCPLLSAYRIHVADQRVLEFGSNIGAAAIVLSALGAQVVGVDVDPRLTRLASANARRHRLDSCPRFLCVADTRTLPFDSASFDFIMASSVLEYVQTSQLSAIMAELHRVLRPNGQVLITATASRLAPQELHSGRWLVNYLPTRLLERLDIDLQQGLGPLRLAKALRGRFKVVQADRWADARTAVHGQSRRSVRWFAGFAQMLGLAPGWISPNIELLLRKA